MTASQAYHSLNRLDRFTTKTDGWNYYESATAKQGTEKYTMRQSQEHEGSLHIDGSHITDSLRFTAGALKLFTNPLGTSWRELCFDFRTKIKPKRPERLNKLNLAIFGSREITYRNLLLIETIFDGNDITPQQLLRSAKKHDSGWHTHMIDLSAITAPHISILFYVQNLESYIIGKEFWLDNIFLLREPVPNESRHNLSDGNINKGVPAERIEAYEKIVGKPYTGRIINNRNARR